MLWILIQCCDVPPVDKLSSLTEDGMNDFIARWDERFHSTITTTISYRWPTYVFELRPVGLRQYRLLIGQIEGATDAEHPLVVDVVREPTDRFLHHWSLVQSVVTHQTCHDREATTIPPDTSQLVIMTGCGDKSLAEIFSDRALTCHRVFCLAIMT